MKYLLIPLQCILAMSKVNFQTAFGKKAVKTSADALLFNVFVFVFSALLFMPSVFGCSGPVWIYASVAAMFTVLYQFFYTKALSRGNVSLTVLIVNFAMVINVLVSYILFDEPISLLRLCGIVLTVVSFFVCTRFDDKKKSSKVWLLLALLSMLTSAGGSITNKFFGESAYGTENSAYVSALYIVAALLVTVYYLILKKKGEKTTFKINFNMIKYALAVGISLAVYQFVYTYSLRVIDGTLLFPTVTGGCVILAALSGVVIFKDKLTKRQIFGMFLGIVSIILMTF